MVEKPAVVDAAEPPAQPVDKLWESIGFHKPLAGFWYNLSFSLISLVMGIFITGIIVNVFYPYPESNGYRNVTGGIFALFFLVMDLGTHMTMDRFIAEARIKNPKKMLHYIQFFIVYQSITGLVQVTAVSIYAIFMVPNTSLSYGVWLMLIVATYQYPGYLGVFGGVLGSLQMYNKTAVLGFITGEGFQKLTELSFVFMGRMWGMANPAVGEIMGIAIGACIGVYVDDFFAMWLSAWFFSKAMKKEGIKARDCFRHDFDRSLVKECVVFGLKTGLPWLEYAFANQMLLFMYIFFIPQYTTFLALSGMIGGIAGLVNWGGVSAPTPLLAESYLNGKKRLTQYYIAQTFRYITLFQFLFLPTIISVYFVLGKFFVFFNMTNYMLALPFFFSNLVRSLQQPYTSFADALQLGTNHPTSFMWLCIGQDLLRMFFMPLWIVWLALPAQYGLSALVWIIPCGEYPAIMFKTVAAYVYINKRICPLKVGWWQTAVAPVLAGACVTGLLLAIITFVFTPLDASIGFLPAVGISLGLMILVMLFTYMPLTGALGAWDTDSLREFKQAARMSGPSKWFVWPLYLLTEKACRKSKLFNKFPIKADDAIAEARELLAIKESHQQPAGAR
jgi:hypothetical protein